MANNFSNYRSQFNDPMLMLLDALGNSIDYSVKWAIQHASMQQQQLNQMLYQQIVHDAAREAVSLIHATVDVSEIVAQIDELNAAIERLGK